MLSLLKDGPILRTVSDAPPAGAAKTQRCSPGGKTTPTKSQSIRPTCTGRTAARSNPMGIQGLRSLNAPRQDVVLRQRWPPRQARCSSASTQRTCSGRRPPRWRSAQSLAAVADRPRSSRPMEALESSGRSASPSTRRPCTSPLVQRMALFAQTSWNLVSGWRGGGMIAASLASSSTGVSTRTLARPPREAWSGARAPAADGGSSAAGARGQSHRNRRCARWRRGCNRCP